MFPLIHGGTLGLSRITLILIRDWHTSCGHVSGINHGDGGSGARRLNTRGDEGSVAGDYIPEGITKGIKIGLRHTLTSHLLTVFSV